MEVLVLFFPESELIVVVESDVVLEPELLPQEQMHSAKERTASGEMYFFINAIFAAITIIFMPACGILSDRIGEIFTPVNPVLHIFRIIVDTKATAMDQKKILFANIPADGHFSPLTGIAMQLKGLGHDVRWYTSKMFAEKLQKLDIQHYPFKRALEVNQFNVNDVFPERKKLKAGVAQLKFDLKNFFIYRSEEYFQDIAEIIETFPFDIFVCDATFTAGELVKEKFKVPSIGVGVTPIMSFSKDLPPYGLGITPNNSFPGRFRQKMMRLAAKKFIFKEAQAEYNKVLAQHELPQHKTLFFDIPALKSNVFIQSGTPGFEYSRSDMPGKLRFVGPLHPYKKEQTVCADYSWKDKLDNYEKVILISQGTFEADHSKLINPTLEALKDEPYLLIVATGYHHTEELRKKYQQDNIVIEDFVDFNFIMPKADLYITNGGYGGTLLAIENGLPMVAAGINEGKNEICARIGYFKLGINLNTEKPSVEKIKKSVKEVLSNPVYRKNVEKLRDEFKQYDTSKLCADYILNAAVSVN